MIFSANDPGDEVVGRVSNGSSKFAAWMECNSLYPDAKLLTYAEMPSKFIWKRRERIWFPRRYRMALGRVTYVPMSVGEAYYLRLLLNIVRGPESYTDIKTVQGVLYKTFKEACYAYGLLDDDKEYIDAIDEASFWVSAKYLRRLFVILLTTFSIALPSNVWDATWKFLCDDVLHREKKITGNPCKYSFVFYGKLRVLVYRIMCCPRF